VDRASGWHASAQNVTCVALPDPYYAFAGWAGDVQGDTNALTMTVPMDRPRRLTARFGAAVADHGVPLAWLRAYRLTNAPPREEALADRDRDGRAAWQEFYAGTDPNDPASRFAIVDFGIANGSNRVVWLGGTNGARFPFTVQSAGSLRSGWRTLDGAVTRSGSGTNAWLSVGVTSQQSTLWLPGGTCETGSRTGWIRRWRTD
jgi:hypothetical protein